MLGCTLTRVWSHTMQPRRSSAFGEFGQRIELSIVEFIHFTESTPYQFEGVWVPSGWLALFAEWQAGYFYALIQLSDWLIDPFCVVRNGRRSQPLHVGRR